VAGSRRDVLRLTRRSNWPPGGGVSLHACNLTLVHEFTITKARGLTSHAQLLTLLKPQDVIEGSDASSVASTPTTLL